MEQELLGLALDEQALHEGPNGWGVVAQSSGEMSGGGVTSCIVVASRISGLMSNRTFL